MANKIVTVLLLGIFMTGCSTMNGAVKTDVKYVYKPLLVCPAPPAMEKPLLLIDQLSEEDKKDPGKVAQAYKASVKQLTNYLNDLELVVKQYDATSKQYEELKKIVDEQYPQQ